MGDTEPPSVKIKQDICSRAHIPMQKFDSQQDLEKIAYAPDKTGVLLQPEEGQLSAFNCSIPEIKSWPKPFLYRVEYAKPDPAPNTFFSFSRRADNKIDPFGRYSVIKLKWLKSFTEFTDDKPRTLIAPTESCEIEGTEDPRVTYIEDENQYYIAYTAFDGTNACVALATTKDFKEIEKHGIISSQITLEKMIKITDDGECKKTWQKRLDKRKHKKQVTLYPTDKDAYIIKNGKLKLHHRLGKSMQVAEFDKIKDLQGKKGDRYWEDYARNLSKQTVLRNTEHYFSKELIKLVNEKLGWGSPLFKVGDKALGLWHGVSEKHDYCSSFLEMKNDKVVGVIKNPLLKSDDTDIFYDPEKHQKRVKYATAGLVDEKNKQIYIYFTSGDKEIHYYATSEPWTYEELNQPNNRLD